MKNLNKLKSTFLVGLFFLSMPAFSFNQEAQKCIDVDDPAARLNCYDALFQENKSVKEVTRIPEKTEVITIDEKKTKDYGLEKPKENFSITAKIVNVKDIYDRTPVNTGQEVSISEGFMSGYVMKGQGKKTSLRVRRVK